MITTIIIQLGEFILMYLLSYRSFGIPQADLWITSINYGKYDAC